MEIIAIKGVVNAGKTRTCKMLYEKLQELGAESVEITDLEGTGIPHPKVDEDFKAVLRHCGRTIGIYSAGDDSSNIKEAVKLGKDRKCDNLILAIRNGVHYNRALQGYRYERIDLEKEEDDNRKGQKESETVGTIVEYLNLK